MINRWNKKIKKFNDYRHFKIYSMQENKKIYNECLTLVLCFFCLEADSKNEKNKTWKTNNRFPFPI